MVAEFFCSTAVNYCEGSKPVCATAEAGECATVGAGDVGVSQVGLGCRGEGGDNGAVVVALAAMVCFCFCAVCFEQGWPLLCSPVLERGCADCVGADGGELSRGEGGDVKGGEVLLEGAKAGGGVGAGVLF